MSAFQRLTPHIVNNIKVREPQIGSYKALSEFYQKNKESKETREVGIVLPVGCGKSGCVTITPFAFKSKRTLVIAPGVDIAKQLEKDFTPISSFYDKCDILLDGDYPEPVEIRGSDTNIDDLKEADVVITNIQQLQGDNNKWLSQLENDFFDLIIFDEGHHSIAATWMALKEKFSEAFIVNYSATPERADGQIMSGEIVYSFPIIKAIQLGYVKELKGVVLNPESLKYVREEDGGEIEVSLEEVIRLGEEDADFRRSIVTSKESLYTIVDASITQLMRMRDKTQEPRLKIIASALNYQHCIQVVEAYRSKNFRADYVHSKEDGATNQKILDKLKNHELDVIVQVRKLNEGFDHPYLSVAAIFSIFSNLSPFVQFVGRIMRVITQNSPEDPLNKGVVVFHAGSNIIGRWTDFQKFSTADQKYYQDLLELEEIPLINESSNHTNIVEILPKLFDENTLEVRHQSEVSMEELYLIKDDPKAIEALKYLQSKGINGNIDELLKTIPTTKVQQRKAKREALADKVKHSASKILQRLGLSAEGKSLDKSFRSTNYEYIVVKINNEINKSVGKKSGERSELNIQELSFIEDNYLKLLQEVESELKERIDGN